MENIWGSAPRGNDVSLDPADAAQFGSREHQLAVNGYYPTYNPGTAFANQCRTVDNPDGWVFGSGGYTSRPRISAMWYALSDAQKQIQLDAGAALRANGYSCPGGAAAAIAASPFFNTPSQLPASSPYYAAPDTVYKTPQTTAQAQAAVPVVQTSNGMNIRFSSSNYVVGGQWSISISGAKPGGKVSALAAGNTTQFGTIDANGNWNLTGTFGASEVGTWDEIWYVDNVVVGEWKFTVAVTQSNVVSQQNNTGNVTNTTNKSTTTPNVGNELASSASALGLDWVMGSSVISGVPNLALLVGAAVGLYFVTKSGGR